MRSAKERRGNNAANGLDLCTENFRSRRIGGCSPAEFWLPRPPGRDFNIEIARAMKHQAAAAQAEQEWIPKYCTDQAAPTAATPMTAVDSGIGNLDMDKARPFNDPSSGALIRSISQKGFWRDKSGATPANAAVSPSMYATGPRIPESGKAGWGQDPRARRTA